MMTASELQRKLLYFGFSDLTDYLRNSPLNRYLYKQFLDYKEYNGISTPIISLFNELYYQCVRIDFDSNPGENLKVRYLNESELWLKSRAAAELVFDYVWVLLRRKGNLSFNEECFLERLSAIVIPNRKEKELEQILKYMEDMDIKVPDQFAPMHYPVDGIPIQNPTEETSFFLEKLFSKLFTPDDSIMRYGNCWMRLTENYSHTLIERYVKLYSSVDDRLALLDRIEHSCTPRQYKKHEDFFLGLRANITSGNVVYKVIKDGETPTGWIESEIIGAQECLNPYTNELKSIADQYKRERDEARKQNEEQKKAYDMEIAKMKANYEADIAELKKEKGEKTKLNSVSEKEGEEKDADKKDISLSVSEIADLVKERFSKEGAMEVSTMLYHLAVERGCLEEELFKMIDGILPAVLKREPIHQTFNMPNVEQFNNNPQTVNNYNKKTPEE